MKTIQVSEETYNKIKDNLKEDEKIEISSYEDMIGKSFFFRTVTYHTVGRVIRMFGDVIELENASWIPDSGRYSTAILNGELDEVEYIGNRFVKMSSIVDFDHWVHELPNNTK